MKAMRIVLIILLLGTVFIAGCWNARELRSLAIVSAIGVDPGPNHNEVKVSFQIINPSEVASGTSGGMGAGKSTAFIIYSTTGSTIFEAIRHAAEKVPRQMFFAHVRLLVISEELAKKGIDGYLEIFERSHEARLPTLVMISRNSTAEEAIRVLTPLEKINGNALFGKSQFTEKLWSKSIGVQIDDVVRALQSKGREPIISGIQLVGKSLEKGKKKENIEETKLPVEIEVKGIALFQETKLKRWIDGDDARGVVQLLSKLKSTVFTTNCHEVKDGVGIELIHSKTQIKAEVRQGIPYIHINVRAKGNITDVKCGIDLGKSEELRQIEKNWREQITKELLASIEIAQSEKSDIFGFGEVIFRSNPKAWGELEPNWSQKFAESKVDVKVTAVIRRPGMRLKSYMIQEEES